MTSSGNPTYKGSAPFDQSGFYCPYIPMGFGGTYVTRVKSTLSMDLRDNQGGWFDGVATLHVNDRHLPPEETLRDIAVWCVHQWGAPGFGAPAKWKMDRDLIFVHDANLLVELKLHWHGVEL
ncbi:MAG: hypothetical protein EOP83_10715 [Verrucomicrobiaceae bacterium]|nr:MAG: hypothetical protein EOP83_10715 [Verrucomicrobiaceae bacterium]